MVISWVIDYYKFYNLLQLIYTLLHFWGTIAFYGTIKKRISNGGEQWLLIKE